MAENKKSFILYADLIHTISKTPDDVAGRLFKTILEYVNDNNPKIENDLLLEVLFEPIKQTLKRDLLRYEEFRNKQSENGKKGGRPKNQAVAEKPKETQQNPENPSLILESQKSLNDSVSVNDSVIVNDSLLLPKVTKDSLFKNEVLQSHFLEFLEMRKKIKKPMTKKAQELFKTKLEKLSNKNIQLATEIINQSILNCWQDIYELKTTQNNNGKSINNDRKISEDNINDMLTRPKFVPTYLNEAPKE